MGRQFSHRKMYRRSPARNTGGHSCFLACRYFLCAMPHVKDLRILFLGTPEFAAVTLQKLLENGAQVVAVVTAPDKPSGRGLQVQASDVKKVALAAGLKILQPEKLKNEAFQQELKELQPDLGIVVAFRMLPESVWRLPKLGTFNLHGSLLPDYRGAAPINWALINGETKTGVTTFFLQHEIDTGDLLLQEEEPILPEDNAGTLYEKLMHRGAGLVWKTLEGIAKGSLTPVPQREFSGKTAPKLYREDGRLDFQKPAMEIHNRIRGLSPFPGAFTMWNGKILKIARTEVGEKQPDATPPGELRQLAQGALAFSTSDHWLLVTELQPEGKRKMTAKEFMAGHPISKI